MGEVREIRCGEGHVIGDDDVGVGGVFGVFISGGVLSIASLVGFITLLGITTRNGIMLVSSILNFQTARFTPGNDLPYILFLPTYTATAWYHGRSA